MPMRGPKVEYHERYEGKIINKPPTVIWNTKKKYIYPIKKVTNSTNLKTYDKTEIEICNE